MSDQGHIAFQLRQDVVPDLDPDDVASVRSWRKRVVEDQVRVVGRLPHRVVLVAKGLVRVGDLRMEFEPKIEIEHAVIFRTTAMQPDVGRAYREGEITVEEGETKYRALVILEFEHATGRWWTAQRRVGTNAAQIGVLHGEWIERTGEGLEALGELAEWVDTSKVEILGSDHQVTPTPKMGDLALVGNATLKSKPPADPAVIAKLVGEWVDREMPQGPPRGFEVYVFKSTSVDRYLIRDPGPVPIDDIVRALSAGPADAVALRYLGIAQVDGESFRAIICAAEAGGRRHDRVLALKLSPKGQFERIHSAHDQDHGTVGPEGCWLGVAPKTEGLEMFAIASGPEIPEG